MLKKVYDMETKQKVPTNVTTTESRKSKKNEHNSQADGILGVVKEQIRGGVKSLISS